jgi:hypothetical protein
MIEEEDVASSLRTHTYIGDKEEIDFLSKRGDGFVIHLLGKSEDSPERLKHEINQNIESLEATKTESDKEICCVRVREV